eukprot:1187422-Prorocentrum_minimum.AAC.3
MLRLERLATRAFLDGTMCESALRARELHAERTRIIAKLVTFTVAILVTALAISTTPLGNNIDRDVVDVCVETHSKVRFTLSLVARPHKVRQPPRCRYQIWFDPNGIWIKCKSIKSKLASLPAGPGTPGENRSSRADRSKFPGGRPPRAQRET